RTSSFLGSSAFLIGCPFTHHYVRSGVVVQISSAQAQLADPTLIVDDHAVFGCFKSFGFPDAALAQFKFLVAAADLFQPRGYADIADAAARVQVDSCARIGADIDLTHAASKFQIQAGAGRNLQTHFTDTSLNTSIVTR